jgi:uncharacterized protein
LIDILRGFALLGILVVNFWGASGEAARGIDKFVSDVLEALVSSSFYPLFSFLFGLGFAMQLLRARDRGAGVVATYVRRILALFLIGTFHAVVIWPGDILVIYSVLGLLLVALHRLPDRWLLSLAVLPLLVALVPGGKVRSFVDRIGGERAAESRVQSEIATNERIWSAGALANRYNLDSTATRAASFTSSVTGRWQSYQRNLRNLFSRQSLLGDIPAFFLIGFVVGRRRILQEASKHRKGLARAAMLGLIMSVAGAVLIWGVKPKPGFLENLAWSGSDYGTTLFYIAAISLGVTFHAAVARVFRVLAPAGRIGLTNYLLQSTTMMLLFSHYGASLPRPTTTLWLGFNLIFYFGLQVPFSHWWVKRFQFGPAEWVWRSLTYGKPQPMRLEGRAAGRLTEAPTG